MRDANLDPDSQALLRRPVEARLAQYRTLKAQKDFAKLQNGQRDSKISEHTKKVLADQNKNDKVAELMKQYNTFYREAKYAEAEKYARLAKEIDPDNPVVEGDRKSTRLNSSHIQKSRMPSSA